MKKSKAIVEQDGKIVSAYGFDVGQNVFTKVDLWDEYDKCIPAGSLIRIVAITPKVFYTKEFLIQKYPKTHDNKEYFFNAVRAEQNENYGQRIREHFVTISSVKPLAK